MIYSSNADSVRNPKNVFHEKASSKIIFEVLTHLIKPGRDKRRSQRKKFLFAG